MNKLFKLIADFGKKTAVAAKGLWTKFGSKSTGKVAAWASKNKSLLQAIGISATAGAASGLASSLIANYVSNKEDVADRWITDTGTNSIENAVTSKRRKVLTELTDCINSYRSYNDVEKDDNYKKTVVRMLELVNYLVFNESDEEVRRIGVRAAILIPGCLDTGLAPEEGFSNPLVLRSLSNLAEDAIDAEDIEGSLSCALDLLETGAPFKNI